MQNKKVAIIIVNWNGEKLLENCLESIFQQTYKKFEVYFVDNGSEDGSVEYVNKNFPKTKVIKLKENKGFARPNNIGIREAFKDREIEYIICLNNDTKVDKNWLSELVKTAGKEKEVGMVASKAFFPDGKIQNAGLYISSDGVKSSGGGSRGFDEKSDNFNKEEYIFAPSGCSALYKRKMLEETGLFDGDFFAYSEDSDLGFRAQLQGWKCLYNPKSQLIHYHSKTSGGAGSPTKAFYTKRNSFLKVFKNCYFKDLIIYAVRDIKKYSSYLKQNNKNQSVDNLRKSIGTKGAILIVLKVYGSILFNLPKFLFKRVKIRQNQKISKKEYYNLFKKFSK